MVYAKCTPFDPLITGGAFTRGPHSLLKVPWFLSSFTQRPLFCVKNTPNFHIQHVTKTPHWKLLHFCHEKTVNFVTERPLLFKCPDVRLFYTNRVPRDISTPLYSLPVNVCLTHWGLATNIGLSCRVNDRAIHAEPFTCKAFRVNYTRVRITHA